MLGFVRKPVKLFGSIAGAQEHRDVASARRIRVVLRDHGDTLYDFESDELKPGLHYPYKP